MLVMSVSVTMRGRLKEQIMSNYLVLLFVLISLVACEQDGVNAQAGEQDTNPEPVASQNPTPGQFEGTVLETVDAAGYTYALLDTDQGEVWLAGPMTPVEVGDVVGAGGGSYMGTYHSKSLDRDFENLYFVSALHVGGMDPKTAAMSIDHPPAQASEVTVESPEDIEPIEGGTRVAEVYRDREALAGQQVTVKGKVVKFNSGIMGTNWIHLQDGTGDAANGTNDLTITTDDVVQVGDVITVSGVVAVDKDIGAGYSYEVIVENASRVNP